MYTCVWCLQVMQCSWSMKFHTLLSNPNRHKYEHQVFCQAADRYAKQVSRAGILSHTNSEYFFSMRYHRSNPLRISVIFLQQFFMHPPQSTCCSRAPVQPSQRRFIPGNVVGFFRSSTMRTSRSESRLLSNFSHLSMRRSATNCGSNWSKSGCVFSRDMGALFR